jgi:hypothetical protein
VNGRGGHTARKTAMLYSTDPVSSMCLISIDASTFTYLQADFSTSAL